MPSDQAIPSHILCVADHGVLGSVHDLELAGFECGDGGLIVHAEDCWIVMKKGFDDELSLI